MVVPKPPLPRSPSGRAAPTVAPPPLTAAAPPLTAAPTRGAGALPPPLPPATRGRVDVVAPVAVAAAPSRLVLLRLDAERMQLPTGYFAPYGALLPGLPPPRAPWAAPNAAGVLGPRPPPPHQAYPVAAALSSSGPTWEQYHQLYAALQNLSVQHRQAGGASDWFLDTCATLHVAGPSHGEDTPEIQ
uniref:Predicted protein n=1 Tax=Hordeum vulgare subsp. vulgare TaxID=112509 RepID=F2DBP7_HORVV|nr:predicted protein [Hordeum vulgare subsp. vulgare]